MNSRHPHVIGVACAASVLLSFSTAFADLTSPFDANSEGWTGDGLGVSHFMAGGNPGGHLTLTDGNAEVSWVIAPSEFLGDLSEFNGGTISFDARLVNVIVAGSSRNAFGVVRISDGSQYVETDLAIGGEPTAEWETYSSLFTASRFSTTETNWLSILSNVRDLRIGMDSIFGQEVIGFDNPALTAIPEATAPTLVASIAIVFFAALALRRCRLSHSHQR